MHMHGVCLVESWFSGAKVESRENQEPPRTVVPVEKITFKLVKQDPHIFAVLGAAGDGPRKVRIPGPGNGADLVHLVLPWQMPGGKPPTHFPPFHLVETRGTSFCPGICLGARRRSKSATPGLCKAYHMVSDSSGKSTDIKICDFELRHRWDMAVAEGDGIPCQICKSNTFSNDFALESLHEHINGMRLNYNTIQDQLGFGWMQFARA